LVNDKSRKRDFHYGIIFTDESDPTVSLYNMRKRMQGKIAPDPDGTRQNPLPPILMEDAFTKLVNRGYDYARNKPGKPILRDYVLHRLAFFLVYDEDFTLGEQDSIEEMIERAYWDNKAAPWNPILDNLSSKYIRREWGWDGTLLSNEETWSVEEALPPDQRCRAMFPSYWSRSAFVKKQVRTAHRERQVAETKPAVAETKPAVVSGHPILSAIAERLGEKRFDLWFGQDTKCDVVGDTVVFTVHNLFTVNSIRRHCSEEVDAVIKQLGYKRAEYNVKPQEPTMTSDESVSIAMASARECNLEHYLANIDAFITPVVSEKGVMSFTERQPPGLKGDDLRVFLKAKSKRIKEMFEEYEGKRRQTILTAR